LLPLEPVILSRGVISPIDLRDCGYARSTGRHPRERGRLPPLKWALAVSVTLAFLPLETSTEGRNVVQVQRWLCHYSASFARVLR
jgi:hypothetical protein